jgi:hypothetical protein
MSSDATGDALRTLSQFLVSDLTVGDTLQRVAELALAAIPAAEVAGMSMLGQDGQPITSVYTDETSPEIDVGQYESGQPGSFTDADADAATGTELAAAAAIVMANSTAYWTAFELSEQVDEAMRSRAVIEQAKGVIMASIRCDADLAFDVLRQQSQSENRKLGDIAAEIVSRQVR